MTCLIFFLRFRHHENVAIYRKSDGRKYSEGVANIKEADFPFPAPGPTVEEVGDRAKVGCVGDPRSEDIANLQARLHEALAQLEQSNSECVQLAQQNVDIKSELNAFEDKCKSLSAENAVLRRRVSSLDPDADAPPKPGPGRKSFENLTPRNQKRASRELQAQVLKTSEERGILPVKLAAFLTYR